MTPPWSSPASILSPMICVKRSRRSLSLAISASALDQVAVDWVLACGFEPLEHASVSVAGLPITEGVDAEEAVTDGALPFLDC
eukprot:1476308-Rhodomonas_salina.1